MSEANKQFKPGRYASIDIGTVTCRMLVADVDSTGAMNELARGYTICNLGEDVDKTGVLKETAMQRVIDALKTFKEKLETFEPAAGAKIPLTAVATSAARDTANAEDFVRRVEELGIDLHVIPGEKEASLSFKGVSKDFPGQKIAVVDVGGGSTEIVLGSAQQEPSRMHSFNIGCRRATERFLHSDPPRPEEMDEVRAWVRDEMRPFFQDVIKSGFRFDTLVAVAGTATSVVAMHEKMEDYDSSRVHKTVVDKDYLREVFEEAAALPLTQRKKLPGLDPGRAPVIVAGLLILQEVLDLAQVQSFTVSESDILHGIILDAAHN
ncbi:MAG: Ppx/GppA family phosphatase [Eggerthellaceae bacterium]|jgi:exopolyphosphatase/guanosine-5'-triphosphate,3'-diphosphate pyrophosphatase